MQPVILLSGRFAYEFSPGVALQSIDPINPKAVLIRNDFPSCLKRFQLNHTWHM